MAKITLQDITDRQVSSNVTVINANSDLVSDAIENTLSRDGTSPNEMEANLDMNSHRILNLPAPVDDTEPIRLIDLENFTAATGGSSDLPFAMLETFNAVGDGVTDDAAAIAAALSYAAAFGARILGTPGKTYRIATGIFVSTNEDSASIIFDLNGSTLFVDDATGLVGLSVSGEDTAFLTTTLSVEPIRGATNLTLTSVTGIQQGDLIEILSPALSSGTITVYHHYVVSEVDGNQVWIEGTVAADINAAQVTADGKVGAISVKAYRLSSTFQIMNGTINAVDTEGVNSSLVIGYYHHVLVDNIIFTGHTRNQCHIQWCGFANVRDCSFRDYGYLEKDQGYVNPSSAPDSQGFGYGIITSRVYQVFVSNCRGGKGWHMYDASRGTMNAVVENCFLMRASFGVSTHESAWHFNVINCVFEGGNGVIGSRCVYLTVKGCIFRNMLEQSVTYSGDVQEVRIYDCLFNTGFTTGTQSTVYQAATGTAKAGTTSSGWTRVFEMVGCTHLGVARVHAGFYGTGRLLLKNNVLADGAYLAFLYSMFETLVEGNSFGAATGNITLSVYVTGVEAPVVTIQNNTHKGGFSTALTAFISVVQGDPVLTVYNNVASADNFLRFQDTTAGCLNFIGNINHQSTGRLFLGAATNTVTNCYNNVWSATTIQSGGVLVTAGANNNSLLVPAYNVVATNAAFTIFPFTAPSGNVLHTGTLTADRLVTLSTTFAYPGFKHKIVRTGSGAFNLDVGGLKNLVQNTWCEVTYNGSAWYLSGYGAL